MHDEDVEAYRKNGDIPWHQDSGYGELDPPEDLTVFIALTDMDERVPWVRMMSDDGRPVLDDPHAWMIAGEARPEH